MLAHSGARVAHLRGRASSSRRSRGPRRAARARARRSRCCPVDRDAVRWPTCARAGDPRRRARARRGVAPDDVATIVYTSGTTGPPKGCVLTHANLLATMRMYEDAARDELEPGVVIFMFLPLAHVLARIVQIVTLDVGAHARLLERRPEAPARRHRRRAPDALPVGPARVREDPRRARSAAVEDASPRAPPRLRVGASPPARGVRAAERRGEPAGLVLRAGAPHRRPARARRACASCSAASCASALTGAAPIGREVLEFFDACGVLVLEGYGMTETCAAATLNTPDAVRFGTVGRPLPGSEVAIAEDGEILMRGPHVFARLPPRRRGDGARRSTTAGCARATSARSTTTASSPSPAARRTSSSRRAARTSRPTNLETALRETRWISQAVVVRRQPAVPRRAADARPG